MKQEELVVLIIACLLIGGIIGYAIPKARMTKEGKRITQDSIAELKEVCQEQGGGVFGMPYNPLWDRLGLYNDTIGDDYGHVLDLETGFMWECILPA